MLPGQMEIAGKVKCRSSFVTVCKTKIRKIIGRGGGWTALGPPVDMLLDTNFTKILPVVHIFSIKIMSCLKMLIGIKSNTKQCTARLSLHSVKLSRFIGGKLPKKGRQSFMIVTYLCVCKSKEYYTLRCKSSKFQYIH